MGFRSNFIALYEIIWQINNLLAGIKFLLDKAQKEVKRTKE